MHLYIKWTYKREGGVTFIQNNFFVSKWKGLYPGELKTRGALPGDFTVYKFIDKISVSQDIKRGDKQFEQLAHVDKISAQSHKFLYYACMYSLPRLSCKN